MAELNRLAASMTPIQAQKRRYLHEAEIMMAELRKRDDHIKGVAADGSRETTPRARMPWSSAEALLFGLEQVPDRRSLSFFGLPAELRQQIIDDLVKQFLDDEGYFRLGRFVTIMSSINRPLQDHLLRTLYQIKFEHEKLRSKTRHLMRSARDEFYMDNPMKNHIMAMAQLDGKNEPWLAYFKLGYQPWVDFYGPEWYNFFWWGSTHFDRTLTDEKIWSLQEKALNHAAHMLGDARRISNLLGSLIAGIYDERLVMDAKALHSTLQRTTDKASRASRKTAANRLRRQKRRDMRAWLQSFADLV